MTDHTDLIAQLNNGWVARPKRWSGDLLMEEAADALQAAQAEIEAVRKANIDCVNHFDALRIDYDQALARLAVTEEANSMLLGRNKWLEHVLAVQTSQGLQSVADALTIEQLNDKVERLMAVQPSQAGGVSKQDIYDIAHRKATRYVCTAAPSDVMYGFSEMHLLDFVAAINAKESGK